MFDFIEGWYNLHRLHSSLGYDTPAHYERQYAALIAAERKEELADSETENSRTDDDIRPVLAGTSRMSSVTLSAKLR